MTPRNTRTGAVLEAMILPALAQGGYAVVSQVLIGKRLSGGRHIVDAVAEKDGRRLLISLKWQQTWGTAEQKVPFEVMSLTEHIRSGEYAKAYLVLGGEGWTLRDFYIAGGLQNHLQNTDAVEIVTLESFVGRANRGAL